MDLACHARSAGLAGTYSIDYLYGRLSRFIGTAEAAVSNSELGVEMPIDRLRHRYASEIDEATFERKLDRLLETETLQRRNDEPGRGLDLRRE